MEKLVLIDGNSLINRAFYAMPILVTKVGVPTNAVYGFMNMFFKMLSDEKPTYVAVAFDLKAPTFRHKMYAEYKGTRKPMPEELRPQIPMLKEVLGLMGVTCLEKEGIEADDIIGTIAKHTDIETIIYTGDKDSFQLVDPQTKVYFTKRGITETDVYDADNFEQKTGITPAQIIELKALMGDASDNIPGVSGIGEKTAKSLLQKYKDIDGVYANIGELKGKQKENLLNDKESAYLSKTLATINVDCGITTDVSKMTVTTPFSYQVKKKFIELEFKSLIKKEELFELPTEETDFINDDKSFIPSADDIVITKSADPSLLNSVMGQTLCVAITSDAVSVYDVDNKSEYDVKLMGETLFDEGASIYETLKVLSSITKNKKIITFNKKELKHFVIKTSNLDLECDFEDVSLIKYVADYSGKDEKLYDCLVEYSYENLPYGYALYCLYNELTKKMAQEQAEKLYKEIELPLSDVLFSMEKDGFKIDYDKLLTTSKIYSERVSLLEEKIKGLVDEPNLNVKSSKQLGEVIFGKLQLGKGKKNKKGFSTSADVLEELEDAHPVISLILQYRQVQKLQSTYIEGFKPLIDKTTGLIHTSFNQTVTATGRLSSKEPNLQNIPVRDDEGRELRKLFVPRLSDGKLISADYSQIELRLLAAFSGCQGLIKAFNDGTDVHSVTASKVFGVPLNEVTQSMRRSAKAVNFGIIYGISEYGLAKNLKVSNAQAREYINSYFTQYPEVKAYMEQNVEFAKKHGYAETLFGRRRYIRELNSPNYNLRQFGERVAMNMPLQGSSADIIKIAMINVYNRLQKEGLKTRLILQVHDELILDAPSDEIEVAQKILKEEMEGVVSLSVALTVDTGKGSTWFDAK